MTYIIPDDIAIREEARRLLRYVPVVPRWVKNQNEELLMSAAPIPPFPVRNRIRNEQTTKGSPFGGNWRDYRRVGEGSSLGEAPADPVQQIFDRLSETMKKEAMKQAAIQTGVSIALATVPVVGWAASLVYTVVAGLTSADYKKQGDQALAAFQEELKKTAFNYDQKVQAAQALAFEQEKPAAIQLAVSGAPLDGLGGFLAKVTSSPVFKTVANPLKQQHIILKLQVAPIKATAQVASKILPGQVDDPLNKQVATINKVDAQLSRADKAVDTAVETMTGERGLEKVLAAINEARAKALASFEAGAAAAITNIDSPAFRANLRKQMAKQLRESPAVQTMLATTGFIKAPTANVAEPSKGFQLLPAAGGLAAVLLMGFLKR